MSNIYHSMLLTIKKKINAVFLLLVIAVSAFFSQPLFAEDLSSGSREIIEIAYPLRLTLNVQSLTGFVEYQFCTKCKAVKLNITPQTKAYANYKQVPLKEVKNRLGRSAEIVYDSETKNIESFAW